MEKRSEKRSRITELDGLRVLMIFIVSWYHIWQQSWMTPVISIPALNIWWSLDWLVRSGYVWVDGTVLLSAFLLYLPLARQEGRGIVDDPVKFYRRKAIRLLPGFWFIILVRTIFFVSRLKPRERRMFNVVTVFQPLVRIAKGISPRLPMAIFVFQCWT